MNAPVSPAPPAIQPITFRLCLVFTAISKFNALATGHDFQYCTPMIAAPDSDPNQKTVWISGTASGTYPGQTWPTYPCDDSTTIINVGKGQKPTFIVTVLDDTVKPPSATNYFLRGSAAQNVPRKGVGSGRVGHNFLGIQIAMGSDGSTTLSTADNQTTWPTAYDFLLLVQSASGALGVIDPKIINNP
jgi:hypothetical protein